MRRLAQKLLGITFAAMLALGVAPLTALAETSFPDVPEDAWYYNSVNRAADMGIIKGYGDGTFGPGDALNRAQAATILWRYFTNSQGDKSVNTTGMNDVEVNAYYTAAANWAVENKVINGKAAGDGTRYFDPNGSITREQLCAIIANASRQFAGSIIKSDNVLYSSMPDAKETDSWAEACVAWCLDNGVIKGKDNGTRIDPLGVVNRAEMATISVNAIDNNLLSLDSKLNTMSWSEIAAVSSQIANASSQEEALEIAKENGLVGSDGKLTGNEVKIVALSDATRIQIQILGFNQDTIAGTTNKAGITLGVRNIATTRAMNASDTNTGGWSSSDMRAYLNGDYYNRLPDDLKSVVQTISKSTNNTGTANISNVAVVTSTDDKLWLPSFTECFGSTSGSSNTPYDPLILAAEGSQYKLFADLGVSVTNFDALARFNGSMNASWWLRSTNASAMGKGQFYNISTNGDWKSRKATNEFGICAVFAV